MKISLPPSIVRLQPMLVVVVPLLVLAVVFLGVIQPRLQAASVAGERVGRLQQQAVSLRTRLAGATAPGAGSGGDVLLEFQRRTPAADLVPELLEQLAQRALTGADGDKVQNLTIETGERVALTSPQAGGAPRVAGAGTERVDPRVELFGASLSYTPVTLAFGSSYSRLGNFLWALRSLPTLVEVRSLEVVPAVDPALVHVSLVMLAYQRMEPAVDRQAAGASAAFAQNHVRGSTGVER